MRRMRDSGVEWIGEIPEGWEIKRLDQIASQVKCKNTGMVETNLLSLSYGNVIQKNIETVAGLVPASYEGYNIIEADDIVLRFTDLQNDQKSLRTGLSRCRGIITSAYVTVRPDKGKSNPSYLAYALHVYDVMKLFYNMGSGMRQGLNWRNASRIFFPYPPLPEQRRITDYLDAKCAAIDADTAKRRELVEKLKEYRKCVIAHAVTRGLDEGAPMRDSGVEWIGEIPEGWEKKPLKYFCTCNDESLGSSTSPEYAFEYIDISTVSEGKIGNPERCIFKDSPSRARRIIRPGDVIVSTVRTYLKAIAKVEDKHANCIVSTGFAVLRSNREIQSSYFTYALRNDMFAQEVTAKSAGLSYPSINASTLVNIPIAVPPLPEQRRITDYLDAKCAAIDAAIARQEELIAKLGEYRKSVIHAAVTGRIDLSQGA